jgi:hypothetical protein
VIRATVSATDRGLGLVITPSIRAAEAGAAEDCSITLLSIVACGQA